jgi:hypothetical protein
MMSEEYARLLIAPLSGSVKARQTFLDEHGIWGKEREQYVDLKTWPRHARSLGASTGILPWEELQEGRVYVVGQFKVMGTAPKITGFQIKPGEARSERIDNIEAVKTELKTMYSKLLKG